MNKRARQTTFLVFFCLFLIIAPIVVLYTAGYRINTRKMSFVKTGVLTVSSEPKGAAVFLDGEKDGETNTVIKNIMPDDHLVRLEKEDYWPWEKTLEVEANSTTFVEKAELFLVAEPGEIETENFSAFAFEDSGQKIAFAVPAEGWTEIWSRNLITNEELLLSRLPENNLGKITLEWSPFDSEILIITETKDLETVWRQIRADGQYEITSPNPQLVWQRDINQFLLTREDDGLNRMIRRDRNGKEEVLAIIPTGQYEFLPSPPALILLYEPTKEKILLIDDRGLGQPILLNTNGHIAGWNPKNQKQLLYTSYFELRIFDAEKINDELLTRLSFPIIAAAWHASGYTVFFSDENSLAALELDNRGGKRQTWILATAENFKDFSVTNDGKTAYLVADEDGENKIFQLPLQE